jgi:hypothetical protein
VSSPVTTNCFAAILAARVEFMAAILTRPRTGVLGDRHDFH